MATQLEKFLARSRYAFSTYPPKMLLVTPSDTVDLTTPGHIRADAEGAVTFIPAGNEDADTVTLNVLPGEVIPCPVRRVLDAGTDDIVLHVIFE